MKFLVTGATGFIGRHVIKELINRGLSVTALSRDKLQAQQLDWLRDVEIIQFSIGKDNTELLFENKTYDCLIHLAWEGLPNYESLHHIERNFINSYNFINDVVKCGVKNVLVTGTCLEYGMKEGKVDEESETNPTTSYGIAKDFLRRSLFKLSEYQKFNLKWARLFYSYGEGQSSKSVISQLLASYHNGERTFKMSSGDQLRDYLPVSELATLIIKLSERKSISGIFNISSGKPVSVRSFVENFMLEAGIEMDLNLGHYPYPNYEPLAFWGSVDKLNETLK